MFGTIRKHQTWLWFVIIAVMIIGMITWQNQLGKSGNSQRGAGNFGKIDDHVITQTEFQQAQIEASLMYFVRTGEWPDSAGARSDFDLTRETYERLFLIRKLDQYDIHSDPQAVARFADLILRQLNRGQPVPLDTFVDQILRPRGISTDDFQQFVEHYLSIQQLASVVGASGQLATPAEIRALYTQEYQELSVEAVFFSASNYLAKVPAPTPEALAQFYTNQQASYREPDLMQVSYVFFNATNYMAQAEKQLGATNLDRDAEEALSRLGTNGLRYGKTPEEARAKIREILVQDSAVSNAMAAAIAFQNDLVKMEPPKPENLAAVAKQRGLKVEVSKPFDKEYGPLDIHLPSNFPVADLFNLTPDAPFNDQPIRGLDGVYVIAYDKITPSRIPPLDEIRARVTEDYKYLQAMRMAQINGRMFEQTTTNALAKGETFAEACAAGKVTPLKLSPFSLSSERLPDVEDRADVNTFKEIAFTTQPGKMSPFIPTREGGFTVYVRERLPLDEAAMKSRLPEFSKLVRQRRESDAFELWFSHEASAALHNIPQFESQNRRPVGQ